MSEKKTTLQLARRLLAEADFVCPHTDADGLASGAIALRARGEPASASVLLGRGVNPWQPGALPRGVPALLDWGVRSLDRACLFVDHHAPEASGRADQVVVSAYGEKPEMATASLMRRLIPEAPAWLAAVGAVGDLGDRAWRLSECHPVGSKTAVRRLVPLVNAPRRVPKGPIGAALEVLCEAPDERAALAHANVAALEEAKARWDAARAAALRRPPSVRDGVAVVELDSPYQVHPVVATVWERRLSPALVIAANRGYLENKINFSVRGGGARDLRALLRQALPDETGEFAHGHDRATGGSLTPERFEEMLSNLRRREGAVDGNLRRG